MLVLARKQNQRIVIGGNIFVKVLRMEGDVVKLGIDAPISIPVHRQEVYDEIQRSNQAALTSGPRTIPNLAEQKPRGDSRLKPTH
jgi:carbon storage regulator